MIFELLDFTKKSAIFLCGLIINCNFTKNGVVFVTIRTISVIDISKAVYYTILLFGKPTKYFRKEKVTTNNSLINILFIIIFITEIPILPWVFGQIQNEHVWRFCSSKNYFTEIFFISIIISNITRSREFSHALLHFSQHCIIYWDMNRCIEKAANVADYV